MSRIGKQPISIPAGVTVQVTNGLVRVTGAKATLELQVIPIIEVTSTSSEIIVKPLNTTKAAKMSWGTTRALIANMIEGVSKGFETRLEIQGVGYKAVVQGQKVTMELGFSHPVIREIPKGLEVKMEKNIMVITGADKQLVGAFSADVRHVKPPEPYKGKGIRYVGEFVIRKEGKRAAAEAK